MSPLGPYDPLQLLLSLGRRPRWRGARRIGSGARQPVQPCESPACPGRPQLYPAYARPGRDHRHRTRRGDHDRLWLRIVVRAARLAGPRMTMAGLASRPAAGYVIARITRGENNM